MKRWLVAGEKEQKKKKNNKEGVGEEKVRQKGTQEALKKGLIREVEG